jgi:hypothetical protein
MIIRWNTFGETVSGACLRICTSCKLVSKTSVVSVTSVVKLALAKI